MDNKRYKRLFTEDGFSHFKYHKTFEDKIKHLNPTNFDTTENDVDCDIPNIKFDEIKNLIKYEGRHKNHQTNIHRESGRHEDGQDRGGFGQRFYRGRTENHF